MREPECGAPGFDRFVPQFAEWQRKCSYVGLLLCDRCRHLDRCAELHGYAHER